MASTTPKNQRKRLTNDEKQKIIEDSKKPGFCRKKVMEKISNFCPKITDAFSINSMTLH